MKKFTIFLGSLLGLFFALFILLIISQKTDLNRFVPPQSTGIPYSKEYSQVIDIPVPKNYQRTAVETNSFADYLRHLPLKQENNILYTYKDEKNRQQNFHFAILKIDPGDKDLQQCADAVIRLRAEFLFAQQRFAEIHFNFTSGDRADYSKYAAGYRAIVNGNEVSWAKQADPDSSFENFLSYLELVFTYAGSYSLNQELTAVDDLAEIQIGDVFINPGFPGHAMIVIDVAKHQETGEPIFMLAQSFMPAQEIHIVKNPLEPKISPWYSINFGEKLTTPGYNFKPENLKSF